MLEEVRKKIDELDAELVRLLERRLELVDEVIVVKKEMGKEVLDTGREEVVLARCRQNISQKKYEEAIVEAFRQIMCISRKYQRREDNERTGA